MKSKVFITSDVFEDLLKYLPLDLYDVTIHKNAYPDLKSEDFIRIGNHYDFLVSNISNQLTREVIQKFKRIKLISNIAVGFDNIDIASATENRIFVSTTSNTLSQAVAEHTLGLLLMALRKVSYHQNLHKSGKYPSWAPTFGVGTELSKKEIGIIGLGSIGQRIAKILHYGFSAKINYLKHEVEHKLSFETTPQASSDFFKHNKIFILACPLNESTKHILGKYALSLMPEKSIVINIGRGDLIDQDELVKNLKKLGSIALDVSSPDPLPTRHPLMKSPKVFITPHIASATIEARRSMVTYALQTIHNFNTLGPENLKNIVNRF